MKTAVVMSLALLTMVGAAGCSLTVEQPVEQRYPGPHTGPGPHPAPPPPPGPRPRPDGRVTGTVVYHVPGRLDRDTVLGVELYEVRRQGGLGERLGQTVIRRVGPSPVGFKLTYNPNRVDWGRDYVLIATIRLDGRVIFENAGAYPVITKGRSAYADIKMEFVGDGHLAGPPPGGGPPHHDGPRIPLGPVVGQVRWRSQGPLPPNAVLQVELWDAARLGKTGGRLVRHELTHLGKPPVGFKLAYDPRKLEADRDYVVVARVLVNNRVVLRTADTARVITKGRPMQVEVDLRRAGND